MNNFPGMTDGLHQESGHYVSVALICYGSALQNKPINTVEKEEVIGRARKRIHEYHFLILQSKH